MSAALANRAEAIRGGGWFTGPKRRNGTLLEGPHTERSPRSNCRSLRRPTGGGRMTFLPSFSRRVCAWEWCAGKQDGLQPVAAEQFAKDD